MLNPYLERGVVAERLQFRSTYKLNRYMPNPVEYPEGVLRAGVLGPVFVRQREHRRHEVHREVRAAHGLCDIAQGYIVSPHCVVEGAGSCSPIGLKGNYALVLFGILEIDFRIHYFLGSSVNSPRVACPEPRRIAYFIVGKGTSKGVTTWRRRWPAR
jgi:hypothetical protein